MIPNTMNLGMYLMILSLSLTSFNMKSAATAGATVPPESLAIMDRPIERASIIVSL